MFGPIELEEADNEHVVDRELMLANLASHSSIGSLPPDRLEAALDAARDVLERRGIERERIPIRRTSTPRARRPARATGEQPS